MRDSTPRAPTETDVAAPRERRGPPLRVAHVVSTLSEVGSGLSIGLPALCEALAALGEDVSLHVLRDGPPCMVPSGVDLFEHRGVPDAPLEISRRRTIATLGFSPSLFRALRAAAKRGDILHSHSLWMFPNVAPGLAVLGTGAKLVVTPHGTLAPWALATSKWKKRAFWAAGQGFAVRRADCLHATSDSEYEDIRALGLRAPVAIIPVGVEIPPARPATAPKARRELLFLGRVHPKKGVDSLVRVWARLFREFAEWDLRIVGPDNEGYLAQMQALSRAEGGERVIFDGLIPMEAKTRAYQEASLFVLPTHSENFALAVAEALAAGTPAVVTKGAPWAGLQTERCGLWIEHGDEALERALRSLMTLPRGELSSMGQRGRDWMIREFSWAEMAEKMDLTYRWLRGEAPIPPWVRLD